MVNKNSYRNFNILILSPKIKFKRIIWLLTRKLPKMVNNINIIIVYLPLLYYKTNHKLIIIFYD